MVRKRKARSKESRDENMSMNTADWSQIVLEDHHEAVDTRRSEVLRTLINEESYYRKRYIGVRQRPSGRWVAEIKDTIHKIRLWLGTFDSAEQAARAYDEAACLLRGPNTRTNFLISSSNSSSSSALAHSKISKLLLLRLQARNELLDVYDHHHEDRADRNASSPASWSQLQRISCIQNRNESRDLNDRVPYADQSSEPRNCTCRQMGRSSSQEEEEIDPDYLNDPQLESFLNLPYYVTNNNIHSNDKVSDHFDAADSIHHDKAIQKVQKNLQCHMSYRDCATCPERKELPLQPINLAVTLDESFESLPSQEVGSEEKEEENETIDFGFLDYFMEELEPKSCYYSPFDIAAEEISVMEKLDDHDHDHQEKINHDIDGSTSISTLHETIKRLKYERKFSASLYAFNGISERLSLSNILTKEKEEMITKVEDDDGHNYSNNKEEDGSEVVLHEEVGLSSISDSSSNLSNIEGGEVSLWSSLDLSSILL